MAAAGRVCTGFSKPYFAIYSESQGVVTYTGCNKLGRGVSVNLQPEGGDDNTFYADNQSAESDAGAFSGGTCELVIDGFNPDVRKAVRGLPSADLDGWTAEGDDTVAPYLGVGYITRYRSGGETIFVPTVLAKTQMAIPEEEAATQEDQIEWQTTTATLTLMRDDTAKHNWRYIGADFSSEAAAEEALKKKLGVTTSGPSLDGDE